ncbi:DUF3108 domain-containing protein [Salegentibacter salarius]|uniref:ATP-dependent exonuclease n=1 Tax=Salegentibacter salarius TaxID=435906 RepID=A0A2N0U294_9FLAO|nr:DUF3108 domain-containing protein [Salegentibacter salarius]OEY73712.1 ATP-dependent exonuclease [Salegentibacter salarius]PKD21026.1 ATP-dependent exonuclease [Salegentibacter salarius]SLJ94380.1 Protein of unknown function [Salegentibacter salarius]
MKKSLFTIFLFLLTGFALQAQSKKAFSAGEWFKFRIHYGPFNASYATLEVDETSIQGESVYHIKGRGKSTGLLHWFFKVDDNYQTYIDKENGKPYKFIRKIDEGGYTKDLEIDFDHSENKAYVFDRKHDENHTYTTKPNVHDMLSAFYYIRNNIKNDELRPGDEMRLNLFIDDENMDFKLRFLGREVIKTKFGKVATLKFRPYVMAGRVFKEKESLTFWVSDDANRIPLKIEANLAVGSLDADLDSYKGLKHPFKIIMN